MLKAINSVAKFSHGFDTDLNGLFMKYEANSDVCNIPEENIFRGMHFI